MYSLVKEGHAEDLPSEQKSVKRGISLADTWGMSILNQERKSRDSIKWRV